MSTADTQPPAAPAASLCEGAIVRLRNGEPEAAIADLTEAIRLDSTLARAYYLRGSVLLQQERADEALADLNEAIRLDPDDAAAYLNRGVALHRLGDHDGAAADYGQAVRRAPEQAPAYYNRGLVHFATGALEEAIADFTEAIRLDPEAAASYAARGRARQGLGQDAEAEADLEAAARLDRNEEPMFTPKNLIVTLLKEHFAPTSVDDLTILERVFPFRVRADLQRATEDFLGGVTIRHFSAIRRVAAGLINLADLLARSQHDPPQVGPPQYEEIDIGEDEPVRCLKEGLWLLEDSGCRGAAFLQADSLYCARSGVHFQVAVAGGEAGRRLTQRLFKHLEEAVAQAHCYRGKVLSLESAQQYSGLGIGIKVHRLRRVSREQVILPRATLELLERNVLRFVQQRPRLAELGLSTRKGLLFYGQPGTGKTHTLHYLAQALPGMTTLLISAGQIVLLHEYMELARLLQPSLVVIEDVDLVGMERPAAGSGWEQVLLHNLLNEMDGLRPEAEILFLLTTNRPEILERALASRPGRIDQAIEFALPDEEGRAKLIRLYAGAVSLADGLVQATVGKTGGVSPAFLKELLRRAVQFRLERGGPSELQQGDVDSALEELLASGGELNRRLFGFRVE
jgi:cell division protease FtsH